MNKLPDLYTNSFNKKIDNSIDYIKINNKIVEKEPISKYELDKKIDNIFKSKNYIYKIKVQIAFKNSEDEYTIIGKTKNNLITINNELIHINDILDIKKVD